MFTTSPSTVLGTQGKPVWPEDVTYLKQVMSAFCRSVCGRCAGGTGGRTQIQEAQRRTRAGRGDILETGRQRQGQESGIESTPCRRIGLCIIKICI